MLPHHPRAYRARGSSTLRSAHGAFDLPSIITGVVAVGILTAGVLAAVFGVIPFAQENGAKQDLAAVRNAEAVALAKDGRFMTTDELYAAGYLTGDFASAQGTGGDAALGFERAAAVTKNRSIAVQAGPNKDCYLGVSRAETGKVFYLTNDTVEPQVLEPATVTGCLDRDGLAELTDAIGATTPEQKLPPADVIKAGATPTSFYQAQFGDRTVPEGTTANTLYEFTLQGFNNVTSHDVTWTGTSLKTINATGFTPGASGTRFFVNVHADPKGLLPGTGYVTATIKNKATGETTVKSWKLTVAPKLLVASADYRYTGLWAERSAPAMTSSPVRFVGGLPATTHTPVPEGRYTAEWSGAEALNATINASELVNSGYQERLFIGDVVPKAGGFRVGVATLKVKLTNTLTGAVDTRDFKLTVTPQGDVTESVTYQPLDKYAKKLTFNLPSAVAGDFTASWSLDGDINATMATNETGPALFGGSVTPKTDGLYPGQAKVTATVKHVASGAEFKRTWNVTVAPMAMVQSNHYQYEGRLVDQKAVEMSPSKVNYAFSIPGSTYAPADAFEVVWSGGTALNSTVSYVPEFNYGTSRNWVMTITPKTQGFVPGTDTITVTATHKATGTVLTKTLKLTVDRVPIVVANYSNWDSGWANQTVKTTATKSLFAFGISAGTPVAGYTVSWSGLEGANAVKTPSAAVLYSSKNNFSNTVTPGAGGFTVGVHPITATVTNNFTGESVTKSWTLTVTP